MKTENEWRLAGTCLILVLIGWLCLGAFAEAQYRLGRRGLSCSPSLVRFTGTFFSTKEEADKAQRGDVFDVVVGDKKEWAFVVKDARNLSCVETKLSILNDIFPRRLYFRGAKEPISFLQNPEIAGELITVHGYLYKNSRRFDVTSAEAAPEE